MFKKIRETFFNDVSRAEYIRICAQIRKANLTMVTILSMFATVLIAGMYVTASYTVGFKQNKIVYLVGLVLSAVISLLSVTLAQRHYIVGTILIFLSYAVYYLYGIMIGAVTDPNGKCVTFMVLLVFMPTLFIEKTRFISLVTVIHVVIFIGLCLENKTGSVLTIDIVDSVVFTLLGLASGTVVNNMKIKSYILELKLKELGNTDKLTGRRNRNAFESEKYSYIESCRHLGVIYIDVNGLHEINKQGHYKGDEMLKFIASEISSTFSDELSYRIGGDEFVAFVLDKSDEETKEDIKDMIKKIEWKGYHIAVGFSSDSTRHLDVDSLINEAEKKMYIDKNRYYKGIARQARNT